MDVHLVKKWSRFTGEPALDVNINPHHWVNENTRVLFFFLVTSFQTYICIFQIPFHALK